MADQTASDMGTIWRDHGFRWARCRTCGLPIFEYRSWDHQGGTPPQDHEALPPDEALAEPVFFDTPEGFKLSWDNETSTIVVEALLAEECDVRVWRLDLMDDGTFRHGPSSTQAPLPECLRSIALCYERFPTMQLMGTKPEPNCWNCSDKGWRGQTPCPFCNRKSQNGTPKPEHPPTDDATEPF